MLPFAIFESAYY